MSIVNATLRPLYPREETRYPLRRRLDGPLGRSWRARKFSPHPPGFDPCTLQPVASRYTDWAIAAYRVELYFVFASFPNFYLLHDVSRCSSEPCLGGDWHRLVLEHCSVNQCFSTAGPQPGTGSWHQLYRAARGLRKLQYATRFN